MHLFNWKRDKVDPRDFKYEMLKLYRLALAPPCADLSSLCPPIVDQGSLGSCTGNAAAGMLGFLELKDMREKTPGAELFDPNTFAAFSRLFIYYNERINEGTINEDSGAELRDIIAALTTYGACKEATWPYNPALFKSKPSVVAYNEAANHKPTSYYRLTTLDDMKHCIASGYPFIFGFTVFESFESEEVAKTGKMTMPRTEDQDVGGHEVMAVGYDDTMKLIKVRNSWGTGWGDQGYFYMPYDYITDPQLASDFWTVRR